MRSPGSSPAAAAGEPACTSSRRMLARSASGPERTNISRKATTTFMATPATMTRTFEVSVARSQPAGSVSPSSLPAMRTKPPSGRALMVSSVRRPRSSVKRRGGNPMPNSGTSMPRSRATMRWPSSCTTMSGTTRSTNASTGPAMPVRISIRRPHSSAQQTASPLHAERSPQRRSLGPGVRQTAPPHREGAEGCRRAGIRRPGSG